MKYHIDSSDDEQEGKFIKSQGIDNLKSYLGYAVRTLGLDDLKIIEESQTLKLRLGIFLHNFADRIFRNSEIHERYKILKDKFLGFNQENYSTYLDHIKTFLNKALGDLDKGEDKLLENVQLEDKDYINLLSSIFNKNIKIPNKIPKELFATEEEFRQGLLEALQQNLIKLSFLNKPLLSLTQDTFVENSSELLAFAHIANRNNKNTCKYLKQIQIDHATNTSYTLPKTILQTFNDSHIIHHDTGNIQTQIMGLGAYDTILQKIPINQEERNKFIAQIFNILQNKELDNNIHPFVEQLTHLLFITELQRNTATLFSSPMFLNLIQKELNKYIFPMEPKGAVDDGRLIVNYYQDELPNTYFMDFVEKLVDKKTVDKKTLKSANNILINEGQLFIQWLDDYIGNKFLGGISHQLNFKANAQSLIGKGKNVSIYDIQKLVNDLSILIKYDTPNAKVVYDNAEVEVTNSINTIEAIFAESRFDLQKLRSYKEQALAHFNSKPLILEQLQKVFAWFDKSKEEMPKLFHIFETNFQQNINEGLSEAVNLLIKHMVIWYNIEIDFDKLFSLKASGEKKDQFDPDIGHSKMLIEESEVEVNQPSNQKLEIDLNNLKRDSSYKFLDLKEHQSSKKLVTQEGIFNIIRELDKKSFDPHKKREQKLHDKMLGNKRTSSDIEEEIYNTILEHKGKISNPNELYNIFAGQQQYKDIITQIKSIPGYYDDNELFARIIKRYTEECNHSLKGSGEFGEEKDIDYINSYFGKYTLDALHHVLSLRINDLQLKNIKMLQSIFIDQEHNNISDLFSQISNSKEKIILVPLNLFNKHAVGLIFEKAQNNSIQVKYLDSLNESIPQDLKQLIVDNLGYKVNFDEIIVEQQKYANCGSEVIENFIFYLTGKRVSQEKAIELHQELGTNALLGKNTLEVYSAFEDNNIFKLIARLEPLEIYSTASSYNDYCNHQLDLLGNDVA